MQGVLIDGQHLKLLVRKVEDRAARRFVYAAILHADETVLDYIDYADAVCTAHCVELFDDLAGLHLLAVKCDGNACLEVDGDIGRSVGSLHRGNTHFKEARLVVIGLVCGILEVKTLMAQMPEVLILGVVGLAADLQRNVVSLGVVDLLVPGLYIPLTPRSNDLHVGSKTLDGKLKANLIVALAGSAVHDGIRALGDGDLSQLLADNRTCKRRTEQIGLILCIHLHRGDDYLIDHLVNEIGNDKLACAGLYCLFLKSLELVGLTDVAGDGDDLGIVVVFLQPGDDYGSIKTARICQYDFLYVLFIHYTSASLNIYALIIHRNA